MADGIPSTDVSKLSAQDAAEPRSVLRGFLQRRASTRLNLLAVALLSGVILGYGLDYAGIASAFTDPVAHIRAQDESVYAHISLRMAERGGWLTPVVMGRYLLQKPPLLEWICAFSLKLFGPTLIALRAPSLLAAVAATVLIFFWTLQSYSLETAWTAVALLLSNPLWHTLARLCYTDMLFILCTISALYCHSRDAALQDWRFRAGFAVSTAAAIMTKSAAGLIPLLVLALSALVWRRATIGLLSIAQVAAIVAALAGPWHLYQILVHPQWFWADYVHVQLIGFGTHPPSQSSGETQVGFYSRRLWDTDPVLVAMAIAALFSFVKKFYRSRSLDSALLASWIAVVMCALLAFRYRNLPYASYAIPPIGMLAAAYSPRWRWRTLILSAVFLVKVAFPNQTWGLPLGRATPLPSAAPLRSYAEMRRPNELIVISPEDDEFYASTLALPKVRYAFVDPSGVVANYAPLYVDLGITVTTAEFIHMRDLESEFLRRLRRSGMDSPAALGTAIVMQSDADVEKILRASPSSDFLMPNRIGESLPAQVLTGRSLKKLDGAWFLLADQPPNNPLSPPFSRAPDW